MIQISQSTCLCICSYLSVRSYSAAQGPGGPRYLHYIGILPQFFATGGVVGHLALRPPRHRFDPRFSSPPDIQGEQHHDSRHWERAHVSPHSAAVAWRSGGDRRFSLLTPTSAASSAPSRPSPSFFSLSLRGDQPSIAQHEQRAQHLACTLKVQTPELERRPGPYKFTGIIKLLSPSSPDQKKKERYATRERVKLSWQAASIPVSLSQTSSALKEGGEDEPRQGSQERDFFSLNCPFI